MPSLFDPRFKYVPSFKTDIYKTFRRGRREMAERELAEQLLASARSIAAKKKGKK
jgi:hypothetical protein